MKPTSTATKQQQQQPTTTQKPKLYLNSIGGRPVILLFPLSLRDADRENV